MQIDLLDSIDEVSVDDVELLDHSVGAVGCYHRLRQLEDDPRWQTNYLRCQRDQRLLGLIPLYRPVGNQWPESGWLDAGCDPTGWPTPELGDRAVADGAAAGCLLVGGRSDRLTGLAIDPALRDPGAAHTVLVAIAEFAAEDDRNLVFPYLLAADRALVAEATGGAASWSVLGQQARLFGLDDPDWLSRQRRSVRYNLRHDRELIAAAGVRSVLLSWPELEAPASELIAEHNIRLGRVDHPDLVRARSRLWHDCDGVEFLVFAASAGQSSGYVTGWIWRDELVVHEIGLSGDPGPDRLAVYLELGFDHPIRLARRRGLRTVRLGAGAERTKTARGAELTELYGGLLNAVDTVKLADG